MSFCRELHMTHSEYLEQDADVMLKWREYLAVEAEANAFRQRLAEVRAKSAGRH